MMAATMTLPAESSSSSTSSCCTTTSHRRLNGSFISRLRCAISTNLSPKKPPTTTHLLCVPRPLPTLLTHEHIKPDQLERVFHYIDEDGDGKISPAELRNCMKATVGEELSHEDAEAVVEFSDTDGDGLLGFDDFVKLVDAEGEEEKGRSLMEAFRVYEMEGRGCITPKSLRRALSRLGENKSIEECTVMIRRFDLNGDGVISLEEFMAMMH